MSSVNLIKRLCVTVVVIGKSNDGDPKPNQSTKNGMFLLLMILHKTNKF